MTTLAAQLVNADDGVVVRVMSFNVRTNYAPEDKLADCTNWDALRKENAASQIRTVAPDFVGTQETSDAQKAFFDGALAGTYAAIGKSGGSLNGNADEINAIYYKTSDWKNLGDGMFWFGPNPDAPSAAWNMKYYRTAVWGRFQHIASGQTMCVFNTHYETPGNDEAQTQASLLLLAKLPAICQATDKINVITGDFNAPPTYPAMIKLFQGGLEEPSLEPTYCGWGPTCDVKYDYTLHTVKDGACYTKSEVLRTSFNGCYPSDHAALLGTFCLGGSCCNTTPSPSPVTNSSLSSSSLSSSAGSMYTDRSATNEDNVIPGTVSAGGTDAAIGEENVLRAGGGGSAASEAATQVINTKSTPGESGATGTVMAVLGVVGATAGVVFVVMRRKKKAIDARLDSEKAGTAPAPSYFARQQESDSNDLSPLPPSDAALSPFRVSNSPIPTLWDGGKENRDSRSSSVSYRGPSPSNQEDPYGRDSSTAFLHDSSSNYSISAGSYNSGLQESRIHFSEAFRPDSLDSNGGALTKSQTDFALL
uniref:Endonuclease/exonuclease/phosphatase domain-containing protein n=1 Tax=Globisporangium ultimum (strain ATCC 200006 / CBS 805.95 / DAOM BR144) TaxID=431595 RepID=K3WH76_GLOUD